MTALVHRIFPARGRAVPRRARIALAALLSFALHQASALTPTSTPAPSPELRRMQAPAANTRMGARLESEVICVVEPSLETNVGSPVDGVLAVVNVDRGDIVQSGQLLARLSTGVETAAVDYQSAKAEFLGRKLARNKAMDTRQMIAAQELDEVATDQRLAELELRERREQLRLRSLVSPIRGVIVDRYRHLGDLVKQERIFRIAQLDPLHVETIVPAQYFGRIKPGQTYAVKLELSSTVVKARVSIVDRIIDSGSGTFRVRLMLPNPNFELPAGQRCAVNFKELNP